MANEDGINAYGQIANLAVHDVNIREQIINFGRSADQECLKHLYVTDPRADKERIQDTNGGLVRESYRWILDNSDFQRFRDDPQSRLLWIKGDPGKGKTMLLCGIIDELEKQTPNLVSYFFCQGTNSSLNNATAVLRGLIFLFAIQQPSLDSLLRKEYEHSGRKLFEDGNAFFALSKILSCMLGDPSLARAYIVIDALDECEIGLQQLLKLVVQITSASRVKWVVSSRNKHDVEKQMKPIDSKTRLSLELRANAEHVSHAVGVYIDDRVSQLESLQNDGSLRDRVRRILRQKAGDTFLWAALVVQELKTVESWDVLDVLEEMPMGLEEMYARMMKQIQQLKRRHPEYCRLVLSAATLAYRPLHILELSVLSGLPKDISGHSERVQTIIRMCGSFLTMRDDQVYIVHQSAKDYLSGKGAPTSPPDHAEAGHKEFLTSLEATTIVFPSGRAQGHRNIFLRSVEAMSKTLKRDIYGLRDPGFSIDNLEIPSPDPLASVRYSCVYWIDHLCEVPNNYSESQGDLRDGGAVHEFLQGHLLYWIEALGLCGATSDAVFAVAKLERLLKTVSIESRLLSLTLDAHRFLLHNGLGIKNTPLQTYVSALLFSPTCSLTRKLFGKLEPEWVLTGPTVDERWSPLVKTLEGHGDWVKSVAFSPDGKLILSGSHDKTIKVWDAVTGEVKHTLKGHDGPVRSVAFSPDGKHIASGSHDKTIKVWDAVTGEVKHTLKGHDGPVRSVAFSPGGELIASGSRDKTIKVWEVATGKVKRTLKDHSGWVFSVAFSPDGKLIVSGSLDDTIKIWNAAMGKVKRTLKDHSGWVFSVAFSPDGKLIASGSLDDTIKIWDEATGKVKYTLEGHGSSVFSVAFSPDGKLIASGSHDKTIKIWDAATGQVQHTREGHGDPVRSVAFAPDVKLIASASGKTIKLWDVATGEVQHTPEGHGGGVESVAFSPDGKLITSGSLNGTIKIWDGATGEVKYTLKGHCGSVDSIAFSPDGKHIASGSHDKTIKIWDEATGKVKYTLKDHCGSVFSITFSPDGKLMASGSRDKTINVWDAAMGKEKRTLEGHSGWVFSVTFSPDGKLIASGSREKTIKVWDVATGKEKRTLEGHSGWVFSVTFSPDGKLIASGSLDGTIKVWDAATGKDKRTLKGHGGWVFSVAFSPDGELIASGSRDKTIKVWDAAMGKDKHTLKGHSGWIFSVAFSPDGKLIASGSFDDTIKIWNTATGEIKYTLEGHDGGVFSIAFSPDGNLIASGPHDKTIKVWDAATGEVKHTLEGQSFSFDTTGLYLFTNVGVIKLDAIAHINAKGLTQSQAQAQEARQCGYDLSPDKSWITWNGHKALWLPPEYRPSVSAIWCSVPPSTVVRVAIGCSSRRVIIISFSKPPPVLLPSYL